jgi:hypothetical protein
VRGCHAVIAPGIGALGDLAPLRLAQSVDETAIVVATLEPPRAAWDDALVVAADGREPGVSLASVAEGWRKWNLHGGPERLSRFVIKPSVPNPRVEHRLLPATK